MKSQKLNCEKARNISIENYLESQGNFPVQRAEYVNWHNSPFRLETKASFKVDKRINRWYDHGLGKGGNIIDLVMELNSFSVSETLKFLSNGISSSSFHQQSKNFDRNKKESMIKKVKKLENQALINYLKSRRVNIEIATQFCNEIYYEINDKNYFAIGFKNDQNGYELRNKFWKGCIGKKAITSLKYGHDKVSIFEGFIDFLSYKTLYKNDPIKQDYIISNSTSMVKVLPTELNQYQEVYLYLDNDNSGKNATEFLKQNHKGIVDCSMTYADYKDMNDYLRSRVSF